MRLSRPEPPLLYSEAARASGGGLGTNTNNSEGSGGHVGTHVREGQRLGAALVSIPTGMATCTCRHAPAEEELPVGHQLFACFPGILS